MRPHVFAPLDDSQIISVTQADQRITLDTLPASKPTLRIVPLNARTTALWIKLGDGTVTGSMTTSMRVPVGSLDDPLYIGVPNSETHMSILCEGEPGDFVLTSGSLWNYS
jgi:hypothetical protein